MLNRDDPATLGLMPGTWLHTRNKGNDYLLDRQMQRTVNYSGLPGNRIQDIAVTESMGPIVDRSREHLGSADTAIIVMRRFLMRLARELQDGHPPAIVGQPEHFRTAPLALVSPERDFTRIWDAHSRDLAADFAAAQ